MLTQGPHKYLALLSFCPSFRPAIGAVQTETCGRLEPGGQLGRRMANRRFIFPPPLKKKLKPRVSQAEILQAVMALDDLLTGRNEVIKSKPSHQRAPGLFFFFFD